MKALHAIERRLQDIERKFENKERLGKIVAVKYEKDRWYVKLNDGEDQTPSGGSAPGGDPMGGEGTVKSDWQPWQSHSHGTIKFSVPPKVGQQALMRSVGGTPELSTVEPHHYGPDAPSPHGKQDETVGLIHEKEDQQHWVHQTKDTNHLIIKSKKQQGGISGLGDIGGLGDLAGISQMAGMSGMDFAGMLGSLGNIGNLSNLGSLANLDISSMANLTQITNQLGNIGNLSQLANIGSMLNGAGLGNLAQFGNIAGIAQKVTSGGFLRQVGGMIGGGAGGGAGVPASMGGQKKAEAPKLPDVPEEGDDGVTQVKSTKEFVLKTVGKNKSYYRQDENKVHLRFGEDGEKADVLMDENQVKVQFKDKKAMVKWTEEDLTVQMGDDDKSKIHMTEDVVHLSQGANAHIEIKEDGILYKVGGTSMYLADDGLTVTAGGTFWKFSGSGLHQTGGDIGHNKKSIGFMHIHGATPPPSLPFQGDEGSPHSGGPTDAGGGPGTGVGTA